LCLFGGYCAIRRLGMAEKKPTEGDKDKKSSEGDDKVKQKPQ
jgi:hypothetical protein